ncbi:MAG TPA: xanthine dehydrogenase family protein subunit M [Burkholderiales bacterium]
MKPPPFIYHDPRTLAAALRLLGTLDNAKLLAGGQSLAPMLNFRYVLPDHVVDLNRVDELAGVRIDGRRIRAGAMTRQRALEKDASLARLCPILREALAEVGHFQTRNRGTIGGSLAHLDPAAELPGVMALYDAEIEVASAKGRRTVPIRDWSRGYMTPNLEPDEIVTAVSWEPWQDRHGHAFLELARRRGDFAIVGVGCLLALDARDVVKRAAISLVGVAYGPVRLAAAEERLIGAAFDAPAVEAAAAEARRLEAKSDLYASGAYRQRIAGVLVARALQKAYERARG